MDSEKVILDTVNKIIDQLKEQEQVSMALAKELLRQTDLKKKALLALTDIAVICEDSGYGPAWVAYKRAMESLKELSE